MTKKVRAIILGLAMFSGIAAITVTNDKLFEISKNLEIFISVYKELNTNFVDELDPGTLMRTAIDAMTNSLDPYTNYVSESQIESYWINDDEKYQGIGAKVGMIDQKFKIIEPYEGGPALSAGLKAGDEIISIDGINIMGKKLEEINAIMRGIPGTEISISVLRLGEKTPSVKKIIRGEVNIPNVPYSGFVADNVAYISLTIFTQNAGANISKALKDLKTKNPNLSGVILDLRHNGGGLLHEAVNICNIFIPSGEIVVTTKGKIKERDQTFKTMTPPVDLEIPVVILIDDKSASASEIVSGVIQDLDRGVLIGQRSFGKGLVQNTKELGYNSRLKLTTSKYYIPSGRCIQGVEYENGAPVNIPDHLRSKFKTKNGRTVLDGGGVAPDIKMPVKPVYPITKALLDQYVIFDFVNNFCIGKDSIDSVENFKFNGYQDFVDFTKKRGFTYQLESESLLQKMKLEIEKSPSTKEFASDIVKLEEKITSSKKNDFEVAKSQITEEIEKEIITRYYFQKGKVQHSLDNDLEVKEAIKILSDTNKYKSILSLK